MYSVVMSVNLPGLESSGKPVTAAALMMKITSSLKLSMLLVF